MPTSRPNWATKPAQNGLRIIPCLTMVPSWREVLARGQMRSHKLGAHVSTARPNVRRGMVWGGCSSLRVCACVCAALSCYLSSSSSSLSPVNERDRWCTAPLHPAGSHRVTRWANGRATSTCGGDEEVSRLLRMPPARPAHHAHHHQHHHRWALGSTDACTHTLRRTLYA